MPLLEGSASNDEEHWEIIEKERKPRLNWIRTHNYLISMSLFYLCATIMPPSFHTVRKPIEWLLSQMNLLLRTDISWSFNKQYIRISFNALLTNL